MVFDGRFLDKREKVYFQRWLGCVFLSRRLYLIPPWGQFHRQKDPKTRTPRSRRLLRVYLLSLTFHDPQPGGPGRVATTSDLDYIRTGGSRYCPSVEPTKPRERRHDPPHFRSKSFGQRTRRVERSSACEIPTDFICSFVYLHIKFQSTTFCDDFVFHPIPLALTSKPPIKPHYSP